METDDNKVLKKKFVRNIIFIDIGLLGLAGLVAFVLNLSPGLVFLLTGALVGGIGAWLGQPNPDDPDNPRNKFYKYYNRPNEAISDAISYANEHKAPRYAFENVMAFAGITPIGLGILLLILRVGPK